MTCLIWLGADGNWLRLFVEAADGFYGTDAHRSPCGDRAAEEVEDEAETDGEEQYIQVDKHHRVYA